MSHSRNLFSPGPLLRYEDVEGNKPVQKRGPGDVFYSPEEAAYDWAMNYNDNSIKSGKEYGSTIYEVTTGQGTTYYSYTKPRVGTSLKVTPSPPDKGHRAVAYIHSHGRTRAGWKTEAFSDPDIRVSEEDKINSYLATPGGLLLLYEVGKKPRIIDSGLHSDLSDKKYLDFPKDEPIWTIWDDVIHWFYNN